MTIGLRLLIPLLLAHAVPATAPHLPVAPSGPSVQDGLARSALKDGDLSKLGDHVAAYFNAMESYDYKRQEEALEGLDKAMASLAKKAKLKDPRELLRFVGDWDRVLELAKPDERELKTRAGKGFFKHVFVDRGDPADKDDDLHYASLLSLPAGYAKGDLSPALLALKPVLSLPGPELEREVQATAERLYTEILPSTIVIVPLGSVVGTGRTAETREVDSSWLSGDGPIVMFSALRVLIEQVRHDRSRLVLDGWGSTAGLDALRVATGYPSWFAGTILRSSALGDDMLLASNLQSGPVLYVRGATDADVPEAEAVRAALGEAAELTLVEEPGAALAPSEGTRKAVGDWLAERRRDLAPSEVDFRIGEPRFQSAAWLKADDVLLRSNARPSDPDFPRMKGSIDRASNTVTIETVNVVALSVYLSDALVDLDKPVGIVVNGKERRRETFPRDAVKLLDTRFYNADGFAGVYPAVAIVGEIDPNVPTQPAANEPPKSP